MATTNLTHHTDAGLLICKTFKNTFHQEMHRTTCFPHTQDTQYTFSKASHDVVLSTGSVSNWPRRWYWSITLLLKHEIDFCILSQIPQRYLSLYVQCMDKQSQSVWCHADHIDSQKYLYKDELFCWAGFLPFKSSEGTCKVGIQLSKTCHFSPFESVLGLCSWNETSTLFAAITNQLCY